MSNKPLILLIIRVAAMAIPLSAPSPLISQWLNGSGGVIHYDGGNVGIGTTSPTYSLTVQGGTTQNVLSVASNTDALTYLDVTNQNAGTTNNGSILRLITRNAAGSSQTSVDFVKYANGGFWLSNWEPSPVAFTGFIVGSSERMRITSGGNVGIGTTTPGSKLAVNGTITTKEVVVTATGWSDYVFDKDHQLAPLSEVASFVKENHHLPDIPSAEEVSEKGVNLGDMQAKLLAKIEELTLHMIEAEKRSSQLEQENSELRHDSETLKERIARLETAYSNR